MRDPWAGTPRRRHRRHTSIALQHAAIEVRRVSTRHTLTRAHRAPALDDLFRLIPPIEEVRPQRDRAGSTKVFQSAREAERPLVEDDRPAMIVQRGHLLAVTGHHLHRLELAV